jgi:ABC-type uncharacterized transport system fused permease/ATPase subunit
MLNIVSTLIFWVSPPIIITFTFLIYLFLENEITASKTFFTIIIFNIVQSSIKKLPGSISSMIQIWSSLKRIEEFLFAREIDRGFS